MLTVSSLAGPQDAELEDQIKGYPSQATVEEALKQQRPKLKALHQAEMDKREEAEQAVGGAALQSPDSAPETSIIEAADASESEASD